MKNINNGNRIFKDREEAGKMLALKLFSYMDENVVIFALPRGGVVVGCEVALKLNAPLDTVVVRKLGAPHDREFGFGAIAPGDVVTINDKTVQMLGLTKDQIAEIMITEKEELERRVIKYRSGEYIKNKDIKTIILIDDGLATGATANAAIQSIRRIQKPDRLIFAVPVCSKESAKELEKSVDEIICLNSPDELLAIGQWYESFEQVNDEKVLYSLTRVERNLENK